ncbi:MAG: hypothetical protein K0U37_07020 [Gammaproteobacteria bacterium]|nr:hypothetical protein [Gammaproteobacteria bacterium]
MIGSHFQSFLFGQVFGLYFVIMSIIFLSRADYYKALIAKLEAPASGVMMSASIFLFIGLFLVLVHNLWLFKPVVMVTVICWLFVIKSVLWLAAPERMFKMTQKLWAGKGHYYLFSFMLVLGVFMMARAFYLFMAETGSLPMRVLS